MRASGLLSGFGAAMIALVFATSCSPSGQNATADTPVLFQWEDYVDPPFLEDYKKAHNNETPPTAIFADEDEAFAKMRAGYKPDVMGPCYYEFPRWQEAGLLQPTLAAWAANLLFLSLAGYAMLTART